MTLLPIFIFVLTLIAGFPIAFVMALTGITHMVSFGYPGIADIVSQKMFYGINTFSYTCIAFFIAAGKLMNAGGVTQRIVDVAQEFIGHKRGGLGYAVILVGMVLAAILGSANAVAVILCSIMIPAMVSSGYDDDFAGSVVASSGILGCIIPPSIDFVIYSVLAGVSVRRMFVAGIFPGIFLGLCFMVVVYITAKKRNYPKYREHFSPKDAFKALIHGIPSLMVPVIIVGGVMGGVFTPTESGAIACAAATILGFAYRKLHIKDLPKIFAESGLVTAGIMLIISAGNILSWTLSYDNIPEKLVNGILGITSNPYLIMLLIILMLFAVGCVMEAFAAELILVPVLAPLAEAVGYDPIHFGLIVIIMLTIALATPPVGMLLFTTSKVSRIDLVRLNKAIWPFVAAGLIGTLILAYTPVITTFLPNLLYGPA
ncbi:MAG: TRAP transporter large permease [Clostridiales bacterium]|nr:TRAP transporter large permease [Clostridiales bacterium]